MSDLDAGIHATITIAGKDWDVLGYRLTRQLSAIDRLSVELASSGSEPPEAADVLGEKATLTLSSDADESLKFSGIVVIACSIPHSDDVETLHVEVCPELWRLGKRSHHRVFQKMSVREVTEQVLSDARIDVERQWQLQSKHPTHEYITQYNETDLAFLQRLLAGEGIYFSCDDDAQPKICFCDSPKGSGDIAGAARLTFQREFGWQQAGDSVYRLALTDSIRPDKATLRDFDWQHPKLDLTKSSEAQTQGEHAAEFYCYPGHSNDLGQLEARSQYLLEALRIDSRVLTGETGSLALRPALRFEIEGHPYAPVNGKYVATELRVQGHGQHQLARPSENQAAYGCRVEFSAIPTEMSGYRPSCHSPTCRIPGLQIATTTGTSGDEIHTNEHGQVRVLFPWEQDKQADETSSCWMRTSQVPLGGSMLLPRMGWEVAVSAREGDPDQRVVMSRLNNASTMPPYELPANKARMALQTATTPGGGSTNELRLSDDKGAEEIFLNASKDMTVHVGNNTTESVAVDYATKVGSNRTLKVADSAMVNIGGNATLEVSADQKTSIDTLSVEDIGADHDLSIGGKRTMMIGGDHRRTVDGDSTEKYDASRIEAVIGSLTDATLADMNQAVETALVEVSVGSRSLIAVSTRSESTTALKAILAKGGRGVQASSLAVTVGGAVLNIVKGDRNISAGSTLMDTVAGAQVIKAENVSFEAQAALSLTMGASTITLTPASVSVAGASITVDAPSVDLGIIMNN